MHQKLKEIYKDLNILLKHSEEDYSERRYQSYEGYLFEYNRLLSELHKLDFSLEINHIQQVPSGKRAAYGGVGTAAEVAKHREIISETYKLIHRLENKVESEEEENTTAILEKVFSSFHKVARQLRARHANRETLDVNDEYNVQDLLHALLKIYFDDIRPEEWTPSYAGGSKRMDFLLKNEKTVIEVKKTRNNLSDKEVGEQLLIDIETYKHHENCSKLYCFVYDPEGRIGNPIGLENDLATQSREDLDVKVRIYPK